jgi:hypothetical protein
MNEETKVASNVSVEAYIRTAASGMEFTVIIV